MEVPRCERSRRHALMSPRDREGRGAPPRVDGHPRNLDRSRERLPFMEPTILIIDDEADTRAFLKDALAEIGCRVVEAATGEAGLAACDRRVDLVLLDHRLPDGSGLDLLQQLRRKAPE